MHFCKAQITLGGDERNVYYAAEYDPISWPEVQVIQFVHGSDAVTAIEPFVHVEQSPRDERQRLAEKYRENIVELVFPRQGPNEMDAPGVGRLKGGFEWINPLTGTAERAGDIETEEKPELVRKRG